MAVTLVRAKCVTGADSDGRAGAAWAGDRTRQLQTGIATSIVSSVMRTG